jgi:hypothetical protein
MAWEYDSDDAFDAYDDAEGDTAVDAMLDSLMDEAEVDDLSERARARSRGRGRGRAQQQQQRRQGVPTAKGASAYRAPAQSGYVTQQQLKEAMNRVGEETRRNAEGIKTVNARVGKLDGQVADVVAVTKAQSRRVGTLDTRMKLDSALDFASALSIQTDASGATTLVPDFTQLLRGAVKSGAIGSEKGAFANPWVIGGIGLALRPGFLSSLLTPRTP